MRKTKAGTKNLQVWDTGDHFDAGHSLVASPSLLARCNINSSICNLDTAAEAYRSLEKPYLAAQVAQIVKSLQAILDVAEKE